jgi:cell division transport system permease protein
VKPSGGSQQPASYYVRRAFDSILATPVVSGVTITSICVSVLLAGAVLLVGSNGFRLVQSWGATGVDVSMYLKQEVGEERVVQLKNLLARDPAVLDVRYVSQDEAWQFLVDNLGDSAELLDGLDASILPASLEVALGRALDKESLDERLEAWRRLPEVDDVQYNRQWIDRVRNAMGVVRWVAWALGALALIVSAIIVGATFQLAAFSRREEMQVMRLVGAIGAVYWGPILLAGFLEGLFGSFAALGLLALIYRLTAAPLVAELPMLQGSIEFLTLSQCFTLVFWGACLGVAGSWLGMQRFGAWR